MDYDHAVNANSSHEFPSIVTPRLTLRRFERRDLPDLLVYRNDAEVEHWQGWGFYDEERGERLIEGLISAPFGVQGRGAQIAFELRSTGRLVGDAMLQLSPDDPAVAAIGYTISPAYQRQGLAHEGVDALLTYAVPVLRLRRIEAATLVDNVASIALLARFGFQPCPGAPDGEQRFCLDGLESRW